VLIRTRPTDQFASTNLKINTNSGVSLFIQTILFYRNFWFIVKRETTDQ